MDVTQRKDYFIKNGFIETRFEEEFSGGGEVYQITNIDNNKNALLLTIKTKNQARKKSIYNSMINAGYKKDDLEEGVQFYQGLANKIYIGIGEHYLANIFATCDDVNALKRAIQAKTSKLTQ